MKPTTFILYMLAAGVYIAGVLCYAAYQLGARGDTFMVVGLVICLVCTAPAMWVRSALPR